MQPDDCGCAFVALRTLRRIEELTTSPQVPLETALEVTASVERPSLAVLSCERCRHQRLPLTAVTILCAQLVDWLRRVWNLDNAAAEIFPEGGTAAGNASETSSNTQSQPATHLATRPLKFSLGSYELAADEADALSNELMTLRLTAFSAVLGSLEAALVTSGQPLSNMDTAAFAPACLDLVRANLGSVRTCIRRLKARSLLNK